jgi:hypothetical protein
MPLSPPCQDDFIVSGTPKRIKPGLLSPAPADLAPTPFTNPALSSDSLPATRHLPSTLAASISYIDKRSKARIISGPRGGIRQADRGRTNAGRFRLHAAAGSEMSEGRPRASNLAIKRGLYSTDREEQSALTSEKMPHYAGKMPDVNQSIECSWRGGEAPRIPDRCGPLPGRPAL